VQAVVLANSATSLLQKKTAQCNELLDEREQLFRKIDSALTKHLAEVRDLRTEILQLEGGVHMHSA